MIRVAGVDLGLGLFEERDIWAGLVHAFFRGSDHYLGHCMVE